MSAELCITAELRGGEIMLTVEHGNAERVQVLQLNRAEMLTAMATVQNALATGDTTFARYPKGLPPRWSSGGHLHRTRKAHDDLG